MKSLSFMHPLVILYLFDIILQNTKADILKNVGNQTVTNAKPMQANK